MPLHDALTQRQADPGAFILFSCVQSLKDLKDALALPGVNADAIVRHREHPFIIRLPRRDVYVRRRVLPAELYRVGDQVLQDLSQLRLIRHHRG